MKHLFFIINSLESGGAEGNLHRVASHFSACGHHSHILLISTYQSNTRYKFDSKTTSLYYFYDFYCSLPGILKVIPATKYLAKIYFVISLAQHIRPKFIISFMPDANFLACLISLFLKIPSIISERVYPRFLYSSPVYRFIRYFIYPFSHTLVVQTNGLADWFSNYHSNININVIPNFPPLHSQCSNLPLIHPPNMPNNKLRLLSVGRFTHQKGFYRLINALSESTLPFPFSLHLILTETDTEIAILKKYIIESQLQDIVHIYPPCGNLSEWFEYADIFVLSSFYEGFPNVLLEAMYHSSYVVSSDCPFGPSDLITSGYNGFLLPNDSNFGISLREHIKDYYYSSSSHKAMIKSNARTSVLNNYSSDQITHLWSKLVNSL